MRQVSTGSTGPYWESQQLLNRAQAILGGSFLDCRSTSLWSRLANHKGRPTKRRQRRCRGSKMSKGSTTSSAPAHQSYLPSQPSSHAKLHEHNNVPSRSADAIRILDAIRFSSSSSREARITRLALLRSHAAGQGLGGNFCFRQWSRKFLPF